MIEEMEKIVVLQRTEYDPVCGSNGKTYSNSCEAVKAGMTYYKGEDVEIAFSEGLQKEDSKVADIDKFGNDMRYMEVRGNGAGQVTIYNYDNIAGENPVKITEDIYANPTDQTNGILDRQRFFDVDTGDYTGYWDYDYPNNRIDVYNDTNKLIGWDTYETTAFNNLVVSRRYEYDVGNNMILTYERYYYDIDNDGQIDSVTYVTNNDTDIDGDGQIDTTVTFIDYGDGTKETIVWDTDNDGVIYNEAGDPIGSVVLHDDPSLDPVTGLPVKTYLTMVYDDYTEIDITQDMYGCYCETKQQIAG